MPRGINQFDEDRLDGLNVGDANSSNIVSPGIVTDGLVLHLDAGNYQSYPIAGTSWYDLSGYGNNGTLTNGPVYTRDGGGAISFDGTNDYANLGTSLPDFTTQLTINVWAKISGSPTDGIFCTKGENDAGATANFGFQIAPVNNQVIFYAKRSGFGYTTTSSSFNYWTSSVNNYVVTYNAGSLIFYKNGSSFSSHTFGLNTLPATSGPLYIGFLKGYMNYFPGDIYFEQLYNRALTPTEVAQNYNALRARFNI